jgi:signal transduction histidine kinase
VAAFVDRPLAALYTAIVAAGSVAVSLIAGGRVVSATRALSLPRETRLLEPQYEPQPRALPAHEIRPPEAVPAEPAYLPPAADLDQRGGLFVNLARRLQSLNNREIQRIDDLEREIEDPEILKALFGIDHLATRVRRQAENLAVLGGEAPQRRSSSPVGIQAVLRSAVAEIEHYKQVTIVGVEGPRLHGHIVAEIIHLLAELLENATTFTAPDSPKVVLRAQHVTAGLAIEVQDRGLGMKAEDLDRINRLFDGTAEFDLGDQLRDGRIGLAVVRKLAGRHHVRVRLQTNLFGGIDAAIVLPRALLIEPAPESGQPRPAPQVNQARPAAAPPTAATLARPTSPFPEDQPRAVLDRNLPMRQPRTARVAPAPAAQHTGEPAAPEQPGLPPLPQRRDQASFLRPELLAPTQPTRPIPGHNPSLMAAVQQGRDRVQVEQDTTAEPSPPQHANPEGESPDGR